MATKLLTRPNLTNPPAKLKPKTKTTSSSGSLPKPLPGPQTQFYQSQADIVLFGGAAGSGKSLVSLLDAAKPELLKVPGYAAVFMRRTYPMIRNEGGLWDESSKWYPSTKAEAVESRLEWRFPTGATVRFAHLQHEKNVFDWQGAQIPRLYFDELTHFTKKQFFYLLSRCRTTIGIKPQVRATCNPDADSWVANLVDWWIDEEGYPIPERSGVVRWFVNLNDQLHWGDTEEELQERFPDSLPKSFTFIPAKIQDNPILLEKDPGYLANLQAQHPVDMARLLLGNWKVKFEAGKVFNRAWFEVVESVPDDGVQCRFWDLAATEKTLNSKEPCYTAGVLMRRIGDDYYILDMIAEQMGPADIDHLIEITALTDGFHTLQRWELEGGSAGIRDASHLRNLLVGFDAEPVKPQGDKVTRAKPVATSAKNGKVKLLRGGWNNQFLGWAQSFPSGSKDAIDATSGAYSVLADEDLNWLDGLIN